MTISINCGKCDQPANELWFTQLNNQPALICRSCNEGVTK